MVGKYREKITITLLLSKKKGQIFKIGNSSDEALAYKLKRAKKQFKSMLDDGWSIIVQSNETTVRTKVSYVVV